MSTEFPTVPSEQEFPVTEPEFPGPGGPAAILVEQEGYRWRADDGEEASATWLAAQDTNIARAKTVNTRLRVILNGLDHVVGVLTPQLEYREVGGGAWTKITDTSPEFVLAASGNIAASGEATTKQLIVPVNKDVWSFVPGRIQDDENPSDPIYWG